MYRKLITAFLLTFAVFQVQASEFIATNIYKVAADQTVLDEQWVTAAFIITEGTFKNDLFLTSPNELILNGSYAGNIWGAGSAGASMSGACDRNVRLVGKTVRIDGPVGGNLMALAETIITTTNAVISGNARLIGASVILEGEIQGNVSISAGRVLTLGGTIGGNAKVLAPDILFSRGAQIDGNLVYTANKEIFPDEGIVHGTLERTVPTAEPLFSQAKLISKSLWFIAALMAGIPFIALFPMTTAMAAQLARTSPWKCLIVGFLASGALPVFGIMSISSIIGLPLGSLILGAWAILSYLSRIIMGLVIGTMILRKVGTSIGRVLLSMVIGLAVIYLTSLVPSIGMPVQLAVTWAGMGALLLAFIQKRRMIIQIPKDLKNLEQLENESNKPEEESP